MNLDPPAAEPAEEDVPYPLDAVPLQGLIARTQPTSPPAARASFSSRTRLSLWLLLALDAALAGGLLLFHPTAAEGLWGEVVAVSTLGGRATLTLVMALVSTAVLTGAAVVTGGFAVGTGAERAGARAAGLAAAVTVSGAVLMVVLASALFVLVGGLALLLFGAVTERDNRP